MNNTTSKISATIICLLVAIAMTALLMFAFPGKDLLSAVVYPEQRIHIILSTFTFSVLCIAAVQAIALALQEYGLRHMCMTKLVTRLPPMQATENLLFQLIAIGFALLTCVVITSLWFFYPILTAMLWHKIFLSLFAWIVFLALLIGRRCFGWRGRPAIRWTLSGVFLVMLAYFGSELL